MIRRSHASLALLLPLFALAACDPGATGAAGQTEAARKDHKREHVEWGYDGDRGPERWARLGEEYRVCADGHEESPIDLRHPIPADAGRLLTDYRPVAGSLVNNGHTVQLDIPPGQQLSFGDRRYELMQMHVHHPSEHLLEGRRFPLEFHLVHRGSDGVLGVVGVLAEVGTPNAALEPLFASLPQRPGDRELLPRPFDVSALLPAGRAYLAYEGSLTTPPCTENVDWFVLEKPISVGRSQVARFEALYPANARPVQRQYRRFVLRSGG